MMDVVVDFVRDVAENLPIAQPVVEIGSRPAEGQESLANLRGLFPGVDYIGCDIQEGANVDRIEDVHRLSFDDDSVGTVICVEVLEHVADPLRAAREIHRVLRPGGVAVFSSQMFFPIHAHPWDFWRFTPEGFGLVLEPFQSSLVVPIGFEQMPMNVFGIGVKGEMPGLSIDRLPRVRRARDQWGAGMPVDFGPIRMSLGQLWRTTLQYTAREARQRLRRSRS